jgi:hypothetical protein
MVLDHLPGIAEIATFPRFEDIEPGLVEAVLTQAARFAMSAIGGLERCRGKAEIR